MAHLLAPLGDAAERLDFPALRAEAWPHRPLFPRDAYRSLLLLRERLQWVRQRAEGINLVPSRNHPEMGRTHYDNELKSQIELLARHMT